MRRAAAILASAARAAEGYIPQSDRNPDIGTVALSLTHFMSGKLKALALVVLLTAFGILGTGGIHYRHEDELIADSGSVDDLPVIHVQNTKTSEWGNGGPIWSLHYGAPFDVFISGSLPRNDPATTATVEDLKVEADTHVLLSVGSSDLSLGPTESHGLGTVTKIKGFGFTPVGRFSDSPSKLRVTGRFMLRGPSGEKAIPLDRSFTFRTVKALYVGPWTWKL